MEVLQVTDNELIINSRFIFISIFSCYASCMFSCMEMQFCLHPLALPLEMKNTSVSLAVSAALPSLGETYKGPLRKK